MPYDIVVDDGPSSYNNDEIIPPQSSSGRRRRRRKRRHGAIITNITTVNRDVSRTTTSATPWPNRFTQCHARVTSDVRRREVGHDDAPRRRRYRHRSPSATISSLTTSQHVAKRGGIVRRISLSEGQPLMTWDDDDEDIANVDPLPEPPPLAGMTNDTLQPLMTWDDD
eukprot:CAMPEP_0172491108 /NCGR_PEP_ID=MMETSP1066-20121228/21812_1 /TAXON_ID=671091 /ORGANISM="Coscinodiscus wailesii, Strain CCMP2513" /LENGTH=167 /DNA_ID=CAMNT_0013259969 /DNA_START=45 /DNA_END=545 /DNA_ORIENTATION=+